MHITWPKELLSSTKNPHLLKQGKIDRNYHYKYFLQIQITKLEKIYASKGDNFPYNSSPIKEQ